MLSITTVMICSALGDADGDGEGDGEGEGTGSAVAAVAGPMFVPIGIDTMIRSADTEKLDADQETKFLGMANYVLPF